MQDWIDISVALGSGHIDYPGDPPYQRVTPCDVERGDICTLSHLSLSAHAGTHIDAPGHFIAGGGRISDYPLSRFVLPARVLACPGVPLIEPGHIPPEFLRQGALLFKTDNSFENRLDRPYDPGYVGLSDAAARLLARSGLSLAGIDYLSIDPKGVEGHPAHITLLSHDILILEGLDLRGVEEGAYTLFCAPLSLADAEASPVRAFLRPASQGTGP